MCHQVSGNTATFRSMRSDLAPSSRLIFTACPLTAVDDNNRGPKSLCHQKYGRRLAESLVLNRAGLLYNSPAATISQHHYVSHPACSQGARSCKIPVDLCLSLLLFFVFGNNAITDVRHTLTRPALSDLVLQFSFIMVASIANHKLVQASPEGLIEASYVA
jgi:hypothetical protein